MGVHWAAYSSHVKRIMVRGVGNLHGMEVKIWDGRQGENDQSDDVNQRQRKYRSAKIKTSRLKMYTNNAEKVIWSKKNKV